MRVISLALLVSLTACGVSNVSTQNAETAAASSFDADKLVGAYAMKVKMSTTSKFKIGFFPIQTLNEGSVFNLAKIEKTAEGYKISEKLCHGEVNSKGLGTFAAPKIETHPEVTAATPDFVAPIVFSEKDGKITFERAKATLVVGAKLQNPEADTLPTSSSDKRLEQMVKGAPYKGALATVSGALNGELFYTSRETNSYSGTLTSDGILAGNYVSKMEQFVFESTVRLLLSKVGGLLTNVQNNDGPNSVELKPIAADATCADVLNMIGIK